MFVGLIVATLHDNGEVSVTNVPSFRMIKGLAIDVPGIGRVVGDLAWGGNWFYLVNDHGQQLEMSLNIENLTECAWRIRQAINGQGISQK